MPKVIRGLSSTCIAQGGCCVFMSGGKLPELPFNWRRSPQPLSAGFQKYWKHFFLFFSIDQLIMEYGGRVRPNKCKRWFSAPNSENLGMYKKWKTILTFVRQLLKMLTLSWFNDNHPVSFSIFSIGFLHPTFLPRISRSTLVVRLRHIRTHGMLMEAQGQDEGATSQLTCWARPNGWRYELSSLYRPSTSWGSSVFWLENFPARWRHLRRNLFFFVFYR